MISIAIALLILQHWLTYSVPREYLGESLVFSRLKSRVSLNTLSISSAEHQIHSCRTAPETLYFCHTSCEWKDHFKRVVTRVFKNEQKRRSKSKLALSQTASLSRQVLNNFANRVVQNHLFRIFQTVILLIQIATQGCTLTIKVARSPQPFCLISYVQSLTSCLISLQRILMVAVPFRMTSASLHLNFITLLSHHPLSEVTWPFVAFTLFNWTLF